MAIQPLALSFVLAALCASGCATVQESPCVKGAASISPEKAIDVAVKAVHIKDRTAYKLEFSEGEGGYFVSYAANNEGMVPSFGTVALDYCGKVITVSRPL